MSISSYIEKWKEIQQELNSYIENEYSDLIDIEPFTKFLDRMQIPQDRNSLKKFLYLLSKTTNHHHRTPLFFEKVEPIIKQYKSIILNFFANSEIFDIFKNNKRLLLFAFEEQMIKPNKSITNIFLTKKYTKANYSHYFFIETDGFYDSKLTQKIKWEGDLDTFKKMRKIGENDNFICELIRNDSISEFIIYINQKCVSLASKIQPSIFETNLLLNQNNPTLIEYAAFFGSIQIFQYLIVNNVELTPSLWIYVIHSQNAELIYLLEMNKVPFPNDSYDRILVESIKCHAFEITDYFVNNYQKLNEIDFNSSLKYFNFSYFPEKFNDELIFYDLCKYNYVEIVDILLRSQDFSIDINKLIILIEFLNKVSKLKAFLNIVFKIIFCDKCNSKSFC